MNILQIEKVLVDLCHRVDELEKSLKPTETEPSPEPSVSESVKQAIELRDKGWSQKDIATEMKISLPELRKLLKG